LAWQTSATLLLLAAGAHPKVVHKRLGHAQIGIAIDIYSHVLPSMQVEAAAWLNGLMQPRSIASYFRATVPPTRTAAMDSKPLPAYHTRKHRLRWTFRSLPEMAC
jgi:hypothetical protein